jgi:hypothetical protein
MVPELGGDTVVDHLVLENAEPSLVQCQLSKIARSQQAGRHHRRDHAVDRSPVERAECLGGAAAATIASTRSSRSG